MLSMTRNVPNIQKSVGFILDRGVMGSIESSGWVRLVANGSNVLPETIPSPQHRAIPLVVGPTPR